MRVRAAAVTSDGDVCGVAAEAGDVLLHPSQGGDDVLQAEVGGFLERSAVLGEGEPPEGTEPVVQGHPHRAAGGGESGGV